MSAIDNAVAEYITEATKAFTVSRDKAEIKKASDRLRQLLQNWTANSKTVDGAIRGLLEMVQRNCDHAGAQRGYNERDGSWMNPCPHCGRSE